jgi:hypothetical protein
MWKKYNLSQLRNADHFALTLDPNYRHERHLKTMPSIVYATFYDGSPRDLLSQNAAKNPK